MTAAVESGQMRVVESLWPRLHERVTADALKTAAYYGHTDILRFLLTSAPWLSGEDVAEHAAMGGHVSIFRLLHAENSQLLRNYLVTDAADGYHVDAVAYFLSLARYNYMSADSLGRSQVKPPAGAFLALATLLLDRRTISSTQVMDNAASHGTPWTSSRCTWYGYMQAAENGHAETIKFLDNNKCVRSSDDEFNETDPSDTSDDDLDETDRSDTFDRAASQGHLAVVEHFHSVRLVACTTDAMDGAAVGGHLAVVKFLHTHRIEGCTASAMDGAARNNHLDVMQFLHENRIEGCTTRAMDSAARNGHLDTVKFLHRHRPEGCSIDAMTAAAANGHLDVVKFLHECRPKDCFASQALSFALAFNQVDVVRYFLVECGEELVVAEGSSGFDPPIRDLLKSLGVDLPQDKARDDGEGYYLSSNDTIDMDPPVTWLARLRSSYDSDDDDDDAVEQ